MSKQLMNGYTQDIFELVLARPVVGTAGDDPMLVHLWWRAPQQGECVVQVYVDDSLYDVTDSPTQRAIWLMLDRMTPHRIELLAVAPDVVTDVWQARPELLNTWPGGVPDVARGVVLRDESLPVTAQLTVSVDGEAVAEGPLWPGDAARSGFGALFGEGGFGMDAVAGPGLGEGELGLGPLGTDGFAWRWQAPDLAAGTRMVRFDLHLPNGQPLLDHPYEESITIKRLPAPPGRMDVDGQGVLRW